MLYTQSFHMKITKHIKNKLYERKRFPRYLHKNVGVKYKVQIKQI